MKGENKKTNTIIKYDTKITSHMKDYTGMIFNNHWIAIRPVGRNCFNRMLWEFKCIHCGKTTAKIPSNMNGITCDCQSNHTSHYIVSFYDWCIKNNHEDWIELWDDELNKISIHHIGYSSDLKFWFKCNNHNKYHHSEQYRLSNLTQNRTKGISCNQCNSFAQWGIDNICDDFLEKYWDYDKNTCNPWDISRRSGKKVWIKCENNKHNSHLTAINNCVKYECRCPDCSRENGLSSLHLKCIKYLQECNFKINTEYNCSLLPINKSTGCLMPYDIEVVECKLIIEVMGIQHYQTFKDGHPWLRGQTPQEYLNNRIKYDEFKKNYVVNNGYFYLAIPYTAENNDEYKEMIDNKINEIINA